MSETLTNIIIDDKKSENAVYLSFKNMYIESIQGDLLRYESYNFYSGLSSAVKILLMIVPVIGLGLSILNLTLQAYDNSFDLLWVSLISLVIFVLESGLSAINLGIPFEDIANSHNDLSHKYQNLHRDIIRIFTPLNNDEINIDLAEKRIEIQNRLTEINDNNISIPVIISNNFAKNKKSNSEYKRLMNTYNSISTDNNPLFEPIFNKIINDTLRTNNNTLLDASDNSSLDVPSLQTKFDTLKNKFE